MSISKFLAKRITNYGTQDSLGSRLRARRIEPFLGIIEKLSLENESVDILDIGGTAEYWGIVPESYLEIHNVKITIVNLPGTPVPEDEGPFVFRHADGCDLSAFTDHSFHIAHSNSVIEHVGDWNRMTQFAAEIRRVARCYFVQTPNYWFPIEPHCMTPFFHWLPRPLRIWLVSKFELGHWEKANSLDEAKQIVESVRLLNKREFKSLFPDGEIIIERYAMLAKSFVIIRQ